MSCVSDIYTYSVILIRVVKGTTNDRAVGIIILVSLAVIHKKRGYITVKSAVNEHVISTVIDTSVTAFHTVYVREFVKFAKIGNVNGGSATIYMAVGYGKRRCRAVARLIASNSSARKRAYKAGIYNSALRLRIGKMLFGGVSGKQNSVSSAELPDSVDGEGIGADV